MKKIKLIGIDYSMTSPAICVFQGKRWSLGNCTFHYLTDKKKSQQTFKHKSFIAHGRSSFSSDLNNTYRFDLISQWAYDIVNLIKPDIIAIEGYSMGSAIGRAFDIAENTSILKYKLFKDGYKPMLYAPTEIKKFATGKGNSKKTALAENFIEETGVCINEVMGLNTKNPVNPVSDIIDSYYICKLLYTDYPQLIID